ncbi:MAG: T9SS type A sorting domain-containing protein [Taibaiella sp.]|nr:T9SS type A sorting domain-containing protein [Taibaiella sp.]
MKKYLHIIMMLAILAGTTQANAQSKLIHYWNFNNLASAYHNPGIPAFKANYSSIDTNLTSIRYMLVTGTSSTYAGYIDNYPVLPTDHDTNARAIGGVISRDSNSYRMRNPTDSAYLVFAIPSTHYKNLLFSYAVMASSFTSGMLKNYYYYSTDSGATWKTSGLSETFDTTTLTFSLKSIRITDTNALNNPRLMFKIVPQGNTSGASGNNRFDNVTLDGDTMTTSTPALIHYWNFNGLATAYHNPGIPALKADYSVLDTNITSLRYMLLPGTSSTYAGYIDNYPVLTTDHDTNARTIGGVISRDSNSYRMRNPTDSAYLVFAIPSINYKNLVFSYAVMASSFTSGMLKNYYYYSTDSGATWKTSGLSETYDTTTLTFSLKTIAINDTAAYNNPKLMFKIVPVGNTSGSSGNNRFDNVTLDGIAIDPNFHYHHVAVPTVVNHNSTFVIYPNPGTSNVTISSSEEGNYLVSMYNVTGQRVMTVESNQKMTNINIAQLKAGIYFVNIRTQDGQQQTVRFVKN